MRPERGPGPGPRSGEKSEKSRPESLDLREWEVQDDDENTVSSSPALGRGGRHVLLILTISKKDLVHKY